VLLLAEPVDEWLVAHLPTFNDMPLQAVTKGELELDDVGEADTEKKSEQAPASESVEKLMKQLGECLGDRVSEVRASNRLTESPACIVVGEHDFGINMQRMLKAAGHDLPAQQPVLEINPNHPLITRLAGEQSEAMEDWAALLLEQAILMDGGRLDDPASFVRRMNRLLD